MAKPVGKVPNNIAHGKSLNEWW